MLNFQFGKEVTDFFAWSLLNEIKQLLKDNKKFEDLQQMNQNDTNFIITDMNLAKDHYDFLYQLNIVSQATGKQYLGYIIEADDEDNTRYSKIEENNA